jgi:ABC-type transporter Mla subunit MlaD
MEQGDFDDAVDLGWGVQPPDDESSPTADVSSAPEATNSVDNVNSTVPLLPAVAIKLETVQNAVSALGMRIDSLGSTTTGVSSAMADRLTEYGDTVAQLSRAQAESLDEYRRGMERSVAEVRRNLVASDEMIRRLSSRVEELVTDTNLVIDLVRVLSTASSQTEQVQAPSVSDEKLESLYGAVEGVAAELSSTMSRVAAQRDDLSAELRGAVGGLRNDVAVEIEAAVGRLRDDLSEELRGAVGGLRNDLAVEIGAAAGGLQEDLSAELRAAVGGLRADVEAISSAGLGARPPDAVTVEGVPELVALGEELSGELAALRSEVVQLKRRIGVRGKPSGGLEESQVRELADQIAGAVQPRALPKSEIDRIAKALAAQLQNTFEVVADDEPVPAKPPRRRQ